jgi:predicted metal-binding protein
MNKFPTPPQNSAVKTDFASCFSILDSKGLTSLLTEDRKYDKLSKQEWLVLFEKQFDSFKKENIFFLKPIPGSCIGCKNGCSGFTFLDEKSGFYVDLAIESNATAIVDFTDCVNLENKILGLNKKEQIFMNDKNLHGTTQEFPF